MAGAQSRGEEAAVQILARGGLLVSLAAALMHSPDEETVEIDWLHLEQLSEHLEPRGARLCRVAQKLHSGLLDGFEPSDQTLLAVAVNHCLG